MNESDIEFTVGLDMSPAEQKLRQFEENMPMADAAFQRATGSFTPQQNNPPNIGPTGAAYPRSGAMADSFFEKSVAANLEKEADRLSRSHASLYDKIKDAFFSRKTSDKFDAASNGGVPPTPPPTENDVVDDEDAKKTDEIKQNEEAITGEAKAQNREMNEHHIKLGKTLTILGLIKAALEGIKKLWATSFETQANLIQTAGYLSKDPEGAFRANRDRTREMMYAGIAAWGKGTPFSKSAYDELSTKIQTAREKAMKGQGVDESLTIATQYLHDKIGTNLNAVQLLTGDRSRTNTEVTNELLEEIEKSLVNISKLDESERNRVLGYLRDLIGPEMMDALMANINLNLRTGGTGTAIEKVKERGGASISNANVAEAAREITEAGSELSSAFTTLKQTLLVSIEPAFTKFLEGLTGLTRFLTALLTEPETWLPEPLASLVKGGKWLGGKIEETGKAREIAGSIVATTGGALSNPLLVGAGMAIANSGEKGDSADVSAALKANPNFKMDAANALAKAKSVDEIISAAYMMDERYASSASGGRWLENEKEKALQYQLYSDLISGQIFNESMKGGVMGRLSSIVIDKFAGDIPETFDEFSNVLGKVGAYYKEIQSAFGEGGELDVNKESYLSPANYVLGALRGNAKDEYAALLAMLFSRESTGGAISGSEIKINTEGKAVLTINFTDVFGSSVTKEYEVPMDSKASIFDEKTRRFFNTTTTSTPSGGR